MTWLWVAALAATTAAHDAGRSAETTTMLQTMRLNGARNDPASDALVQIPEGVVPAVDAASQLEQPLFANLQNRAPAFENTIKANASTAAVILPLPPILALLTNETLDNIGYLRNHSVSEFVEFQFRKMQTEYEYPPQEDVNKLSLACFNVFLLGFFGVDRCFVGQVTLGMCKFVTCGGFGVLFCIDFAFIFMNSVMMETHMNKFGGWDIKFSQETVKPAFSMTCMWVFSMMMLFAITQLFPRRASKT